MSTAEDKIFNVGDIIAERYKAINIYQSLRFMYYYFTYQGASYYPYASLAAAHIDIYALVSGGYEAGNLADFEPPTSEHGTPVETYRGIKCFLIYGGVPGGTAIPGYYFYYKGVRQGIFATMDRLFTVADSMIAAGALPQPKPPPSPEIPPTEIVKLSTPTGYSWITDWWNAGVALLTGWFGGIQSAIGGIGSAVAGIGSAFTNAIGGVFNPLQEIGKSLEAPVSGLGSSVLDEAIKATSSSSPDPEVKAKLETLVRQLQSNQDAIIQSIKHSPIDPNQSQGAGLTLVVELVGAQIAAQTAALLIDILHPIKSVEALPLVQNILAAVVPNGQIQDIISMPTQLGIIPAMTQYFNSIYTPRIPEIANVIEMRKHGSITPEEYLKQIAYLGFGELWASKFWEISLTIPDFSGFIKALRRGAINEAEFDTGLSELGIDTRYKAVFDLYKLEIPGSGDLINARMKEIIGQREFTDLMRYHGFEEKWSKMYWDSHYSPPTLTDILTAWRRQIPVTYPRNDPVTNEIVSISRPDGLNDQDVDYLIESIDLDPRYIDIFRTRKYVDPPLNMIRFMFETGNISADQVSQLVHYQGYRPEHEAFISSYITEFQSRLWRRRYLVSLSQGYEKGLYTVDELRTAVTASEYTPEVADYVIRNADVRKAIAQTKTTAAKVKLITESELKKLYLRGKVNDQDMRTELLTRGYQLSDIELLIGMLAEDKVLEETGGPKIALTQAELLAAYKWGEMTRDQVYTQLLLRGMNEDEVRILLNTFDKKQVAG